MKKIILLLLLCSLASCGLFKKIHKEKTFDKIETSSIIKSDSAGTTIDKSVTTITEKADTTVIIPGQVVNQDTYLNMDSLVNGMTAVKNDLLDVKLILNPVTGILSVQANIKPRKVPIHFDKTTTKANDIVQSGTKSGSVKASSNELHKTEIVDKEPKNSFWLITGIVAIFVVVLFVIYKKFF